jgi:hypothetical protein
MLAQWMYGDLPYAREVGHVGEAAGAGAASPIAAAVMEGHDVPPDVLTGVLWLRKGCVTGGREVHEELRVLRSVALQGFKYCFNDGCEVVGHLKDFRVFPQCKVSRYCGAACQKHDWNAGGHKATCGTFASRVMML